MNNKKKIFALAGSIISILLIISFLFLNSKSVDEDDAMIRDYIVTKGDITAGFQKSGIVAADRVEHKYETTVVIEDILVKTGQLVKKGDPLATLSKNKTQEEIDEKEKILEKLKQDLQQANNAKATLELTFNKTINDMKSASLWTFEKSLQSIESRIQSLKNKINLLEAELESVNKEIDSLKYAASSTESGESISSSQPPDENSNTQPENLSNEETKIALPVGSTLNDLIAKKEQLTAEIASLKDQLAQENISLTNLKDDRKKETAKETENISDQQKLHDINLDNANLAIKFIENEISDMNNELTELKKLLTDTTLYAEIDGIVTEIGFKNQEETQIGKSIVTIADMKSLTVTLNVAQEEIFDIQIGQKAEIVLNAFQTNTLSGAVINKDLTPSAENGEVVYKVTLKIDLGADDTNILEGMTAQATIIKKQVKDVLILSNKAISLKDNKQVVLVKDEQGNLVEQEIVTGFSDGKRTEIISGLQEGDMVFVEG